MSPLEDPAARALVKAWPTWSWVWTFLLTSWDVRERGMAWKGVHHSVKLLTLAYQLFLLVCVQRSEKFLDPSTSAGEEPIIMSTPPEPIRGLYS